MKQSKTSNIFIYYTKQHIKTPH